MKSCRLDKLGPSGAQQKLNITTQSKSKCRTRVHDCGSVACEDATVWDRFLHLCSHENISYRPQYLWFSFCSLHHIYFPITGKCIQHNNSVLSSPRHFVYQLLALSQGEETAQQMSWHGGTNTFFEMWLFIFETHSFYNDNTICFHYFLHIVTQKTNQTEHPHQSKYICGEQQFDF